MPSRREFVLSAALAGFAGCIGGGSSDPDSTPTESTVAGATATTTRKTTETTTTHEPRRETPESEAVRWRVAFDDAIAVPPAVADGRAYVPVGEPHYGTGDSSVGALAGLDADDGTPRWTERLPAAPTGRPQVDANGAYCTTGTSDDLGLHGRDQRCLGFDPDGTERWRTDPVDQFLNVLALGDGRAYLATSDDALALDGQRLFAVGLSDGRTRWSVESGDAREGWYRDGLVLVAVGGGMGLAVHDATSGERRWVKEASVLETESSGLPVADGAVVVGRPSGDPGGFTAVNLTDGSERWRYVNDGTGTFVPDGAAVAGGTVVGTTFDGRVVGLDAADGTERWTLDAGERVGSPIVGDDAVYVGSSGENSAALLALDPATGTEQWRVGREAIAPLVSTGDTVVAYGSDAGRSFVVGLSPSAGSERWAFETQDDLRQPVVAHGRVYVYGENGVVRAIDA